ncbi:DNA cytosine methyltransferase, partial [Salmonella enterica]
LWPTWFDLVSQCRPHVIFGEQVASKDGLAWFDAVQLNLEEAEYAVAVVDLCAAGIGAPHIRQRLFWVADADSQCLETPVECGERGRIEFANGCSLIGVDYASSERRDAGRNRDYSGYVRFQSGAIVENGRLAHTDNDSRERRLSGWQDSQREVVNGSSGCGSTDSRLAYADNEQRPLTLPARGYEDISRQWNKNSEAIAGFSSDSGTSPVNGFWRGADWLFCRDGKWRAVEPGLKPLVNGLAGHVGQVRAYGNAIVAPVAEAFIKAYMEATE